MIINDRPEHIEDVHYNLCKYHSSTFVPIAEDGLILPG